MTVLEDIIKQRIREDGPMDMATYMSLCLGHPEHGYYMTRDPFGRGGDFTTAPEISQMFGEMIGAWLVDSWMKMGSPNPVTLLECGPGRGTLIADILRATKNVPQFHDAVQVHLLEMSPVLKGLQQKALDGYDVSWHHDTESIPSDSPLLILGNEFLDALSVRQYVFTDTGWAEKFVNLDINETLCIDEFLANKEEIDDLWTSLLSPQLGDHLEVSHEQKRFLYEITKIMQKQLCTCLFLDYGFNNDGAGATLQAVMDHAYCNILDKPGEADLTAHVNFGAVARQIMEENMTVHGPVSQGDFLQRLGIATRAEILKQAGTDQQKQDIDLALKRLTGQNTDDHEMGALFKVIAFSSDASINLEGFA